MEETQSPVLNFYGKQSDVFYYLHDDETTEIIYGGGAGGGKSFIGCVWHIDRRIRYPKSRGMIGRSKISILEQSTLVTYFNVASLMGYRMGIDFTYNSQKHTITWVNGSVTILKDLFEYPSDPDFTSLGSTEYTDVFIDDITEITQKAYDIVNSRIRYKLQEFNLIPKLLGTCNPAPGWVKETFVSDADGKPVTLKPYQIFVRALVSDNPDKNFVELYSQQLSRMNSDYDRARLLDGDWEVNRDVANPFAFQFTESKHICDPLPFNPNKQLYISVDFNLNPFCVGFSHIWRDTMVHWHVIDEVSIPNGSIQSMVEAIKLRYAAQLSNCRLTGDHMGVNGQLGERDNASFYTQLKRGLNLRDSQVITPANPTHENSRADVNYFLYHSAKDNPDFDFKVYSNCKGVIRDLKTVQCDAFGEIKKKDRKDLSQQADLLDGAIRYTCNTFLKSFILEHQKIQGKSKNKFIFTPELPQHFKDLLKPQF